MSTLTPEILFMTLESQRSLEKTPSIVAPETRLSFKRSIIIAAIEFLTLYWDGRDANCHWIGDLECVEFIGNLFTNITFNVYGLKKLNRTNIIYHTRSFNSTDAAGDDYLLVLDDKVDDDLVKEWLKNRSSRSLVYFNPKSTEAKYDFYSGSIMWPIWRPLSTDYTFIIPDGKTAQWDIDLYVERNNYFDTSIRTSDYINILTSTTMDIAPPQLLSDYDSCAEVFILNSYRMRAGLNIQSVLKISNLIDGVVAVEQPKPAKKKATPPVRKAAPKKK